MSANDGEAEDKEEGRDGEDRAKDSRLVSWIRRTLSLWLALDTTGHDTLSLLLSERTPSRHLKATLVWNGAWRSPTQAEVGW